MNENKPSNQFSNKLPWINLIAFIFAAGGMAVIVPLNSSNIAKMEMTFNKNFENVVSERAISNKQLVESINSLNITVATFAEQMKNREHILEEIKYELDKHDRKIDNNHDSIIILENTK